MKHAMRHPHILEFPNLTPIDDAFHVIALDNILSRYQTFAHFQFPELWFRVTTWPHKFKFCRVRVVYPDATYTEHYGVTPQSAMVRAVMALQEAA